MRKLYGDSLRKEAGFVKVMKSVASKNAQIIKSRAGRHAPDLERVATEVIGTFDKVYEETADAVEEFLARCELYGPKILNQRLLSDAMSSGSKNLRSCSGYQNSSAAIERTINHHVRYFKVWEFCFCG